MVKENEKHPCYNPHSAHTYARVHLPLIRSCNIDCNYCNRDYSCANENRPGVTSRIIEPVEAVELVAQAMKEYSSLGVVGVAGPGEAFAEPQRLYDALSSVRSNFPDMMLCVSSNGYAILDNVDLIKDLNVEYITVTVNTLDEKTASRIYNVNAVGDLLSRQQESLYRLKDLGVKVKVNTVLMPDVNAQDVVQVAAFAKKAGAFAHNIMSFYPVVGSAFEGMRAPSRDEVEEARQQAGQFIRQLSHCNRCRADASGFLQ